MSRLNLQVFYLWRHVLSTAPPFILWGSNLEILFAPLHRSSPFIGGLRCQAIQMEHVLYIAERTQKAVYIVRCLWCSTVNRTLNAPWSENFHVVKNPQLSRGVYPSYAWVAWLLMFRVRRIFTWNLVRTCPDPTLLYKTDYFEALFASHFQ
jgi:hypothetical protein